MFKQARAKIALGQDPGAEKKAQKLKVSVESTEHTVKELVAEYDEVYCQVRFKRPLQERAHLNRIEAAIGTMGEALI